MKLLSTLLLTAQAQDQVRDHLSVNSQYYVSTSKSKDAEKSCGDLGGTLAVVTSDNLEYIRTILPKGKFTVGGATQPKKCNLFSRVGKVTKNKRCRNSQFVCDLKAVVTEPVCTPDNSVSLDSQKYLSVVTGLGDEPYSWHEARDFCADLGQGWGLTIINTQAELQTITNYLSAQCHSSHSIWLGHQYKSSQLITQYGNDDYWEALTLNPSNGSRDQCIELQNGLLANVRCGKVSDRSGLICERHTHSQQCQPKDADELPGDNRYHLSDEPAATTWSEARTECQSKGVGWDLAVIDDVREHKKLVAMTNCASNAFWVGHTESNGVTVDIDNKLSAYFNATGVWDDSDGNAPEPNDKTGIENCVRLFGNRFRDAKCDLQTTEHSRSGIGMGYICEYNESKATPVAEPRTVDLLDCAHNKNLAPFVSSRRGCPIPLPCDKGPRLQINDSWQVKRNGRAAWGFVGTVHLPEPVAKSAWSVLIRFSPLVQGHNFQIWNAKYWNFYNGNRDVLFHKKWWNGDRVDENSFSFVVDGMDEPEYPEVVGFNGRVQSHACFDASMHAGTRSAGAFMQQLAEKVTESNDVSTMARSSESMQSLMFQASEQVTRIRVRKQRIKIKDRLRL